MMIYDSRIIRCNVGTVSSNKQEIEQKYVRNRFHVVGNLWRRTNCLARHVKNLY